MSFRYLSVCSGIDAASVAWAPLGWSAFGFSEIERFPCEVLAHHYGSNLPGEEWSRNGVPNFGDMTQYEAWPDAAIDLLVGGTPCQSFSVAGLGGGLDDARGNLMLVYGAIARKYRPRWLVWENVPGVLSNDEGRAFGSLLGLLSGRRVTVPGGGWGTAGNVEGYEGAYGLAWRVLDAQYVRVDGFGRAVPQRRRRVFVVGYLGDWRRAAAVLFERESLSGNPAPRREARQEIADLASYGIDSDCLDRSGEGAGGTARERSGLGITAGVSSALRAKRPNAVAFGGNNQAGSIDVATALSAHGGPAGRLDFESETFIAAPVAATLTRGSESSGKGGYAGRRQEDDINLVAHALRAEGFDASEDGSGRGTPIVPISIQAGALRENPASGPDGAGFQEGIAYTLEARAEVQAVAQPYTLAIRGRGDSHQLEYRQDGTANAILTPNGGRGGIGVGAIAFDARQSDVCLYGDVTGPLDTDAGTIGIQTGWAVRRLMPLECERLQGFPDGYTDIPRGGKQAADGPRYKALGNSMAVNVMRWLGRRIQMVEALP